VEEKDPAIVGTGGNIKIILRQKAGNWEKKGDCFGVVLGREKRNHQCRGEKEVMINVYNGLDVWRGALKKNRRESKQDQD